MERDRPIASPALVAVIVFALLVAAYVSAYFARGRVGTIGPNRVRTYPSRLEAELFGPLAWVESRIVGQNVYVGCE